MACKALQIQYTAYRTFKLTTKPNVTIIIINLPLTMAQIWIASVLEVENLRSPYCVWNIANLWHRLYYNSITRWRAGFAQVALTSVYDYNVLLERILVDWTRELDMFHFRRKNRNLNVAVYYYPIGYLILIFMVPGISLRLSNWRRCLASYYQRYRQSKGYTFNWYLYRWWTNKCVVSVTTTPLPFKFRMLK